MFQRRLRFRGSMRRDWQIELNYLDGALLNPSVRRNLARLRNEIQWIMSLRCFFLHFNLYEITFFVHLLQFRDCKVERSSHFGVKTSQSTKLAKDSSKYFANFRRTWKPAFLSNSLVFFASARWVSNYLVIWFQFTYTQRAPRSSFNIRFQITLGRKKSFHEAPKERKRNDG